MTRLPTPGGDDGTWGDVLNGFLEVSHNSDGSIANNTIGTNQLQNNAVTNAQLDSSTQNTIASVAGKYTLPGGGIPSTDMTSAVQTSLSAADSSVQTVNSKTPTSGNVTLNSTDVGALAGTKATTAPSSPSTNDLWYDETNDLWKRWNGTLWVAEGSGVYAPIAVAARLIYVDAYGADPTGATDSTSAFLAAQAVGGSNPYRLVMSAGTYLLGTSADLGVFGRKQGIVGQGSAATRVNYVGNGTCIAIYDSSFSSSASFGDRFEGFSINGSGAGSSAIGLSCGNMTKCRAHDVGISEFLGATSIGLSFKNGVSAWSEQGDWTAIQLVQNTNNVVFDSGSFDYSVYEFLIGANPGQNGMVLQNAASLEGCRIELRGNFTAGVGNTACVIGIDPAGGGVGSSYIHGALMDVYVECDGSSGTGHVTINLDGASSQLTGSGVMRFNTGKTIEFTTMSRHSGCSFGFGGTVHEIGMGIMTPGDAFVAQGGTQWNESGSLTTTISTSQTIYLQLADYQAFLLRNGNSTISGFSGALTRVRRIEILFKQPASGAAGTLTWPSGLVWANGNSTLSTANGAVDKARLTYYPSESTWYAEMITNYE